MHQKRNILYILYTYCTCHLLTRMLINLLRCMRQASYKSLSAKIKIFYIQSDSNNWVGLQVFSESRQKKNGGRDREKFFIYVLYFIIIFFLKKHRCICKMQLYNIASLLIGNNIHNIYFKYMRYKKLLKVKFEFEDAMQTFFSPSLFLHKLLRPLVYLFFE